MRRGFVFVVVISSLISGCMSKSKGFDRGALRQQMDGPAAPVTDDEIKKTLSLKPQLPKPFRLGVYFRSPETRGYHRDDMWTWTQEDKQKILTSAEVLKANGEVSDVFLISDASVDKSDLKSLRLAAARHGADALLVVGGISDVDSYLNNWGWTYVALITGLFVPGSQRDALFISKAAMWDVRNEFLYLTADAEGLKKKASPAAFTDERKLIEEAKSESLQNLMSELQSRASALAPNSKM